MDETRAHVPRRRLTLVAGLVSVLAAVVFAATAPGVGAASKATYYLSVGDSLAQGYQPVGGPPSSPIGIDGYAQGYADQLFNDVRGRYEQLRLVKLGCGGETTVSMVLGAPWCGFLAGSQLAQAEQFLGAHRGEIAFVTIDIGANDFLGDPDHASATILTYLPQILARLRAAAGPGVPIIGMSYYHVGLPAVWSETHDISALQAYGAQISAFNGLLESVYAAAGDPMADVEDAFQVRDTTLVHGTPLNVVRECEWTWICASPPLGPDIHANSDGYGVIARAFAQRLNP
jgi:lysophospholipase L1-like esterase